MIRRNAGEVPEEWARSDVQGRFARAAYRRCKLLELGVLGYMCKRTRTAAVASGGAERGAKSAGWLPFWDLAKRDLFHS